MIELAYCIQILYVSENFCCKLWLTFIILGFLDILMPSTSLPWHKIRIRWLHFGKMETRIRLFTLSIERFLRTNRQGVFYVIYTHKFAAWSALHHNGNLLVLLTKVYISILDYFFRKWKVWVSKVKMWAMWLIII